MTLRTDFLILDPVKAWDAFQKARELIRAEGGRYFAYEQRRDIWNHELGWTNEIGQGFDALVECQYGADGPLILDPEYGAPEAFVKVSWDTAYGYQADNGAGCADLHAWLVTQMAAWCDARRVRWAWRDEFMGIWHTDLNFAGFGSPETGRPDYALVEN